MKLMLSSVTKILSGICPVNIKGFAQQTRDIIVAATFWVYYTKLKVQITQAQTEHDRRTSMKTDNVTGSRDKLRT